MTDRSRPDNARASLPEALCEPWRYPEPPDAVTCLQTHISWLFFAGNRVYKLKKPVDLGFVDYSTAERRRRFCHEEVRLNRRLAPEIYLGVASVVHDREGVLRVRSADATQPGDTALDYAVEMRRLPERWMLANLLARGELDARLTERVAARIADFHATCATGPGVDEYGAPDALRAEIDDNFAALDRFAAPPGTTDAALTPAMIGMLRERLYGFLEQRRGLLEARVNDGRIREGHGDLHAGNLCLWHGEIIAYDAIEFSPALRCRDIACEIAFLAMDLDYRGFRGFAGDLVRRFAERCEDPDMAALVPFYKTHLALVRAKVAALKADGADIDEDAQREALIEARRYAQLAASYWLAPVMVIMCGLPGSGKSWAGRAIARPFEARVLRSDVLRKRLAGRSPTAATPDADKPALYSGDMTDATYGEMARQAEHTLAQGRSVVLDATFHDPARRQRFWALAEELGVAAVIAFTDCPETVVRERLAARGRERGQPSDADWQVYLDMRENFRPPTGDRVAVMPPVEESSLVAPYVLDRLIALRPG